MKILDLLGATETNFVLKEIQLYQCEEKEQLLPDLVNCLAVQAYLKMCNLKYIVIHKNNTKAMSPTGQEPLLRCDAVLVSDLETIIQFFQQEGISLTKFLEESELAEMNAYISLVRLILSNAERFLMWADPVTYRMLTKASFRDMLPWPLSWILPARKQEEELRILSAMDWQNKSLDDVYKEVDICLNALSDKLEGSYFFGSTPTELDALLFAHIYSILTTQPKSQFVSVILHYPKIVQHCQRILSEFFKEYNTNICFDELAYSHV